MVEASYGWDSVGRTVTLVLLPGLDGTEIFFRPLVAVLPPWIKPLVVTYPTTGINDYSELLPVVEAAIGDSKEFYVLGWSFSGPLALMLAAKQPNRIRGVILCASFVRCPLRVLSLLRFAVVPAIVHLVRLVHRLGLLLSEDSSDTLRQDKATTLCRVPSRIVAARLRAILALNAKRYVHESLQPILYVAGSRDRVVPRRNVEEVVTELPSTKVVTIDGPHLALYTNPRAAAQVIARFIRESA